MFPSLSILLKSYWNFSFLGLGKMEVHNVSILLKSYWNRGEFSPKFPIKLLKSLEFIRFIAEG